MKKEELERLERVLTTTNELIESNKEDVEKYQNEIDRLEENIKEYQKRIKKIEEWKNNTQEILDMNLRAKERIENVLKEVR